MSDWLCVCARRAIGNRSRGNDRVEGQPS
jgi:hypothetical protein